MDIKEIMRRVVTINFEDTLEQAVEKMAKEQVNSLLVVNESWVLIWSVDVVTLIKAIVPEYVWSRDKSVASFINEEIFQGYIDDNRDKKVKYFMLDKTKTLSEKSSVLDAAIKATEGRQSRIPVVDSEGKPIGVVTRQWVKKYLATKMGFKVS